MADVKNICGYDVKDASARSACSSLDSRVTALEQSGGFTVVDEVTDGNMNAVTSNAVYDAVDTINAALNDIETLYNNNGITLKRNGRKYDLNLHNVTSADMSSVLTTLKSYMPVDVKNAVLYTHYGTNPVNSYTAFMEYSSSNIYLSILSSYGGTAVDFIGSAHKLCGSVSWVN